MEDTFGKKALETHYKFRAAHQAPALKWSSALARDAEVWAKQIVRDGRLRHDNTSDGENVFMVFGREIDGSDAANSWYSEAKNYDFNKSGFQTNTGHFTQVVWKGSRKLGRCSWWVVIDRQEITCEPFKKMFSHQRCVLRRK